MLVTCFHIAEFLKQDDEDWVLFGNFRSVNFSWCSHYGYKDHHRTMVGEKMNFRTGVHFQCQVQSTCEIKS